MKTTTHVFGIAAFRELAGSDCVQESPVGFSGVEQCPDPVVSESSETVGGALARLMRLLTASVGPLLTWAWYQLMIW